MFIYLHLLEKQSEEGRERKKEVGRKRKGRRKRERRKERQETQKERRGEGVGGEERKKERSSMLIHSPNVLNSQGWARQKPRIPSRSPT